MPANLTNQYHKAEAAYRRASTPEEELDCLQEMLRELPKHKGTDKLQAELKQKISRVKIELQSPKKGGRAGLRIPRQGAGRVIVLGGPNAGKSQLIAATTRATPEVAPYPFTTREPAPAMMPFEDVLIQVIDTPPITADLLDPNLMGLVRGADLVLLMADMGNDDGIEQLQEVLKRFADSKTRLARETFLDESDIGVSYTKTLLVLNKSDAEGYVERCELLTEFCPTDLEQLEISAQTGEGLDTLRERVFQALDVVRVYTKLPTKKDPDYDKPFTVKRGGTLLDVAELIHKDLVKSLRHARVWGSQVHDGTVVKGDYEVQDRDVVEIHG
ncbi:MAG: 50S ribosome-binding GTPase [Planctomycetales bacterium]|nr:50S ribosome-binding GTPase [Planctomycetales bacterium]